MRSNDSECLVSVDGTDFRVQETYTLDPRLFSHKFKGAGLRYEVGICIQTGYIVWISGSFRAGEYPDISIFRRPGGMKDSLLPGEKVEADNGYQGEPLSVSTPDDCQNSAMKYLAKANARARHECINGALKNFKALKTQFRHKHCHHSAVFTAIAVLTQMEIECGGITYQINYGDY